MYAFIVNEHWLKYGSKDIAAFLRDVGTPALVMNSGLNAFNEASGFYVKVEPGWSVLYKASLITILDLPFSSLSIN
jgi:hypothetical protein